jgi:hypothetical protein
MANGRKKQTDENDRELEVSMYDNHEFEDTDNGGSGLVSDRNTEKMKIRIHKSSRENDQRPSRVTVSASSHAVTKRSNTNKKDATPVDMSKHVKFEQTGSSNVCFEPNSHFDDQSNAVSAIVSIYFLISKLVFLAEAQQKLLI